MAAPSVAQIRSAASALIMCGALATGCTSSGPRSTPDSSSASTDGRWSTVDVGTGKAVIATGDPGTWQPDVVKSTFDADPDDVRRAHDLLPDEYAEMTSWYFGADIGGEKKLLIWTACVDPADDWLESIPFVVGGGDCYAEGVYDVAQMTLDRYTPNQD